MNPASRDATRCQRVIGWVVLAHWLTVVTIKCMQGRAGEVVWLSHLALALTGLSLVIGRAGLARAVMIAVAVPHLVWLADALGLLVGGRSPTLITSYLSAATAADWVATAHHFYLLPLLWWRVGRGGRLAWRDALGAWLLIASAVAAGRWVAGPGDNINYAYYVGCSNVSWLEALHAMPATAYTAGLLVLAALVVVLPGSTIVYAVTREPRRMGAVGQSSSTSVNETRSVHERTPSLSVVNRTIPTPGAR